MLEVLYLSYTTVLFVSLNACEGKLPASSASFFKSDTASLSQDPSILCAEECHTLKSAEPQSPCALFSSPPCRLNPPSEEEFVEKAYAHSCGHIKRVRPAAPSGVYVLKLPSRNTTLCPEGYCDTKVFCDMETDGGGWTMLQRQAEGGEDFDRGLIEYEEGFGNVSKDHWLGLASLQKILSVMGSGDLLVSAGHEGQSCRRRALYRNFRLLDSDGYPFDYDAFDDNSSLPDILAVSKRVGRFAVYDDPVRKKKSCTESPGYLAADDVCSSMKAVGGSSHAEYAANCAAVHPLLQPSELLTQEADYIRAHWGHQPAACIRVSPHEASPEERGPSNLAAGDAADDCRYAIPHRRLIVHACPACLAMCSYKLSHAGTGGWWWSTGVGQAWVHPNNPLMAGCHSWASYGGLPAAWAKGPAAGSTAALRGLAQVSIAVREADFPSTEWAGEDWCSEPIDDCE